MLPIGHQFSPLGRRLPIQVDICRHCQRDLFLLPLVSTSSVQALAKTDCHSGFTYAETRALDANSFFITTRCTSTFGSGTFHPTVTVTMEYVTFGLGSRTEPYQPSGTGPRPPGKISTPRRRPTGSSVHRPAKRGIKPQAPFLTLRQEAP